MLLVLLISTIIMLFLLLSLTAATFITKYRRTAKDKERAEFRSFIQPKIVEGVLQPPAKLESLYPVPTKEWQWEVIEEILIDIAGRIKGEYLINVTTLAKKIGVVDRLLLGMKSRRSKVRGESAIKLGYLHVPEAVSALQRMAESKNKGDRIAGLIGLGSLATKEALGVLLSELSSPSRWLQVRLLHMVKNLGSDAIPSLIEALNGADIKVRIMAAEILGDLRAFEAIGPLEDALSSEDKDLRARCAAALGKIGDVRSAGKLEFLLEDKAWEVRAQAAKALGLIQHRPGAKRLANLLRDRSWWVRTNAAEALSQLGEVGFDALRKAVTGKDWFAREKAIEQLQKHGIAYTESDGTISNEL